ncbi:RNA polymerase sigma factor (sigma-70 family) [Catalinimonas alkaloidigena]|uniref:RNA polymerase sigma factor n=1 Tax=Catalinimonas alkaloidigena TaxID=1075417 RepID=UPI0024066AF7|nr:sigma-70 family RNA polymerase sigma factor [Catalinimonas alkaloidigena]MDF9796771.1 RNA polymerase sigma factor (sigma-70 family) [Catalinimonas alkaloidigena]
MFLKRLTSRVVPDDASLLRKYAHTGDLVYLGDLYSRYTHLVYGVCLKYLKDEEASKDAVMQLFEKLTISLKETQVREFKSWLFTVTKNHCLMQLRAQQKHQLDRLDPLHENGYGAPSEATIEQSLEELPVDRWSLIEKGLPTLPVEQQECIRLFYLEQKSYQEVADLTGYQLKKVKSYLQNGKRNLKIFVEKNHE